MLESIDYRPSLVLGWVRFLEDDTGKLKTWKRGNAQAGRQARLNALKGLWLTKNDDPRTGLPAVFEEVVSEDIEDVMDPDEEVKYIEGTHITELHDYIFRKFFQNFGFHASTVIGHYLSGKLIASHFNIVDGISSIAAIESVFWKYGFRISQSDAIKASSQVATSLTGMKSVLESSWWMEGVSVIAVRKITEDNNAHRLLKGKSFDELRAELQLKHREKKRKAEADSMPASSTGPRELHAMEQPAHAFKRPRVMLKINADGGSWKSA